MSQDNYFRQFLCHFTHEFANGDIIRKYANLSFSIEEIRERLEFPTPREEIHKMVWSHLLSTKQIILEKPDCDQFDNYTYVKDVSPLGKVSYRKVKIASELESESFRQIPCDFKVLDDYRHGRSSLIYVEIPFGVLRYKEKEMYDKTLALLDQRDAEYIQSMFVERRYVYYRLNEKMERILRKLMEHEMYDGSCFLAADSIQ